MQCSGNLLPLHCISEILISLHDHCISKDLSHITHHPRIFTAFTSCDLYPTASLISGNLLPLYYVFEISISLHCHYISRDLHPTSYHRVSIPLHCISGSLSHITHHPRIPIHCIIALIKPNQHFIIVHDPSRAPTPTPGLLILLGLPRPLQVFFTRSEE